MTWRAHYFLLPLTVLLLHGEAEDPAAGVMSPKEDAIEQMLAERDSPEALAKAIDSAREKGAAEQTILEARFLFHVDREEDSEIAGLLPEVMAMKDKFQLAESEIFGSVNDWLAVTEYVQAIASLQDGNKDDFKKHITEAFWLSPRQGAAFAPHIERIQLMDAMKTVRVDFTRTYEDVSGGGKVAIGAISEGKRAVLLHFWSPWSRECEATLGDFFTTASYLETKGLGVASVLPETSEKVKTDARTMLEATGKEPPGSWIVDVKDASLSGRLGVRSVPAVVLVSPEGAVLFNGHPTDDRFWDALAKIGGGIGRPESQEED